MAVAVPRSRFRRRRRPGAAREALVGYGFVLVPMRVFVLFFIYPMVYAIYISRYDWGILGPLGNVGWKNYSTLWHDTLFRRAVKNTLEYTIWVVPAQMALGLLLAVVVNQRIRFRTFFRGAFYFPSLASSAAITAIHDAKLGLAAAAGVVLFVVIFLFTIAQWVFFGRQEAA